jgi:hypothetical protein
MGIDVILSWHGMTEAEHETEARACADAMVASARVTLGRHTGPIPPWPASYLREAYHGAPYVTRYLVKEAAEATDHSASIPAAVLRERLPLAVMLDQYRAHIVYGEGDAPVAHTKEGALALCQRIFAEMADSEKPMDDFQLTEEQLRVVKQRIADRQLDDHALRLVNFVELAERKEAETGQPCLIEFSG